MLPPHRPFRENPSPKVIIKKKYKSAAPKPVYKLGRLDGRRDFRAAMIVIDQGAKPSTAQ